MKLQRKDYACCHVHGDGSVDIARIPSPDGMFNCLAIYSTYHAALCAITTYNSARDTVILPVEIEIFK